MVIEAKSNGVGTCHLLS